MMAFAMVKAAVRILSVSVVLGGGAAVGAQVGPTTAPGERTTSSGTVSVELGKTSLDADGNAADGMSTMVTVSHSQSFNVATEAEGQRRVKEWWDGISAKQYRFVREYEDRDGEQQYEYAIKLANGEEDKLSGTVRLEEVSSWNEWNQRQQVIQEQRCVQFLEAVKAGKARIAADDVIIVHVCMDEELGKRIEVLRSLLPDGTLLARIWDSPLGSSQVCQRTSWDEHLGALSMGKRKLIEVRATAVFTYEYPGADGKTKRYTMAGSPVIKGAR